MASLFGGNFSTGQATVTAVAARAFAQSNSAPRANGGIVIKALAANTQLVYVGPDATVSSSNGFPLDPGASVAVPLDDPSKIFAISASGSQTIAVIYI